MTLFKRNDDRNETLEYEKFNNEINVNTINASIMRDEVLEAVINAKLRNAACTMYRQYSGGSVEKRYCS